MSLFLASIGVVLLVLAFWYYWKEGLQPQDALNAIALGLFSLFITIFLLLLSFTLLEITLFLPPLVAVFSLTIGIRACLRNRMNNRRDSGQQETA